MKNVYLIVNAFFKTARLQEQYDMLRTAFEKQSIRLQVFTNAEMSYTLGAKAEFSKPLPDLVVMWDKDIALARALEIAGVRVINSSQAIALCDDKVLMHLAFAKEGIKVPKTIILPMTYANIGFDNFDFADKAIETLGLPVVFKQGKSSYGMGVKLLETREQVIDEIKTVKEDMLLQEYIKSSHGRDIRVNVVDGKAICAVERTNDGFCSNVVQGGKMSVTPLTSMQAELAEKATKAVGADFAGVDLLIQEDGSFVVCEINTSAHFGTLAKITGVNIADYIAKYGKKLLDKSACPKAVKL